MHIAYRHRDGSLAQAGYQVPGTEPGYNELGEVEIIRHPVLDQIKAETDEQGTDHKSNYKFKPRAEQKRVMTQKFLRKLLGEGVSSIKNDQTAAIENLTPIIRGTSDITGSLQFTMSQMNSISWMLHTQKTIGLYDGWNHNGVAGEFRFGDVLSNYQNMPYNFGFPRGVASFGESGQASSFGQSGQASSFGNMFFGTYFNRPAVSPDRMWGEWMRANRKLLIGPEVQQNPNYYSQDTRNVRNGGFRFGDMMGMMGSGYAGPGSLKNPHQHPHLSREERIRANIQAHLLAQKNPFTGVAFGSETEKYTSMMQFKLMEAVSECQEQRLKQVRALASDEGFLEWELEWIERKVREEWRKDSEGSGAEGGLQSFDFEGDDAVGGRRDRKLIRKNGLKSKQSLAQATGPAAPPLFFVRADAKSDDPENYSNRNQRRNLPSEASQHSDKRIYDLDGSVLLDKEHKVLLTTSMIGRQGNYVNFPELKTQSLASLQAVPDSLKKVKEEEVAEELD